MRVAEFSMEQVEAARGLVTALDVAIKRVLHRWFGEHHGCGLKAAVAEALDTSVGTVSRQTQQHDIPVQLRLLAALWVLCPELARQVLDELADMLQLRWRERVQPEPTAEDLRAIVSRALEASAGAAAQALRDLADGVVEAHELMSTAPMIEHAIRELEELLASLRRAAATGRAVA